MARFEASLDSEKSNSVRITVPSSARYVEIRDNESRLMAANCHLVDPQDLPKTGWKSSVELGSGKEISFELFPEYYNQERQEIGISLHAQVQEETSLAKATVQFWERLQEWVQSLTVPARYAVTALFLLLLTGASGMVIAYTALLEQFNTLVKELHFDEPFAIRLSAVGRRSLQLDLSLYTNVVHEIFVDWGDPSNPDPVGGTRIYPTEGIKTERERMLLPPIIHEYGLVPPEGLRTTVHVRIVPTVLPEVRPESLSEAELNPERRIWVLPYGIILDPPEAELKIVSPKNEEVIPSVTEVQITGGALTADIHLLTQDAEDLTVYRYLRKIPPPPLAQEATTLTSIIDTSQFGLSGPFRLVVVSTDQLEPAADGTVEWHTIPQAAPLHAVEVRHAGVMLSPTQGEVVSGIGKVRAQVFLPNTYAAAVICPTQADSCWVQNNGLSITSFAEFSINARYGGRDTYQVYLGVTHAPSFFQNGDKLTPRPLRDREGQPVYWIGPVEVIHE